MAPAFSQTEDSFQPNNVYNNTSPSMIDIDGESLTIAQVVDAARHPTKTRLSERPDVRERIQRSVDFLKTKLHTSVYGVTTGFGGSADTRTTDHKALQIALLEHQLGGVLPTTIGQSNNGSFAISNPESNMMPEAFVRGAILIRINSLARGHSGVRVEVLELLNKLLLLNIIPCVPLRGTISASGDLSPLSYVAGAIAGHPDVHVIDRSDGTRKIMPAGAALKLHGLVPVALGPKEGLGLINGTAFSTSAAALALDQSKLLSELSQALSALTLEAMIGTAGSFTPFIHDVTRPHKGQVDSARNIREMLFNSKLAQFSEQELDAEKDKGVLRQDRYPLRTAAQWVGPNLETIALSFEQVSVELNSTTDNPLIDSDASEIHHGGNFQACSPAKAMENTRVCLQQIGKLSFSQLTEMINCSMNRGLPSCLAGDEPSTNFHCKGVDIHAAAYTAELGFLANPVTSHVQSAEMHNQAVNSMAFVSARKTMEANDVLSMLLAVHIYCVCQAVDLRVIDMKFREGMVDVISKSLQPLAVGSDIPAISESLADVVYTRLDETSSMDSKGRFEDAVSFMTSTLLDHLSNTSSSNNQVNILKNIQSWKKNTAVELQALFKNVRETFFSNSESSVEFLGKGTARVYSFVRDTLGVSARRGDVVFGESQTSIGSNISKIYESIQSGKIREAL